MTDTKQPTPCDHPALRGTPVGPLYCVNCEAEFTVSYPGQLPTVDGGTP